MIGFSIKKSEGLVGPVISFTEVKPEEPKWVIEANKFGIKFLGDSPRIESDQDLQGLAKVIADAWKAHKSLVPRIVMPTSKDGL